MKKEQKRYRIRQIISAAMLVLFVLYYADITLFLHTHIINGVTIVHSHFHNSAHEKTPAGGHTTTEITLIEANSLFQSFEDVVSHFDTPFFLILCSVFFVLVHTNYTKGFQHFSSLRAPPVD